MPSTLEDLVREAIDELVQTHPDEILERLPAHKRLEVVWADELISGVSRETLEALLRNQGSGFACGFH